MAVVNAKVFAIEQEIAANVLGEKLKERKRLNEIKAMFRNNYHQDTYTLSHADLGLLLEYVDDGFSNTGLSVEWAVNHINLTSLVKEQFAD